MGDRSRSLWLLRYRPREAAKIRLFCFPYAGGSAAVFRDWSERLDSSIDVWAIEYPGRGSRRAEKPVARISQLIDALLPEMRSKLQGPFAFFGHSMGALVAYELLRRLAVEDGPSAASFIASGCCPPWRRPSRKPIYGLSDSEFIEELRSLDGTPKEFLADQGLMQLLLPMLRADFEAAQTYSCDPGIKLRFPIFVYGGLDDSDVNREHMAAWNAASKMSHIRMFPGGHFFLHSAADKLMRVLTRDLLSPTIEVGQRQAK